MMTAIHYVSSPDRKVLSMMAVVFSGIFVAMLGLQYYSQVTVVRYNIMRGELEALGPFVLGNPHSFFWPLECLGYGFMSLSSLFAAFTFSRGSLERCIRFLFIINGALGIGGLVVFPSSTILLAINFRRSMHEIETVRQLGTSLVQSGE